MEGRTPIGGGTPGRVPGGGRAEQATLWEGCALLRMLRHRRRGVETAAVAHPTAITPGGNARLLPGCLLFLSCRASFRGARGRSDAASAGLRRYLFSENSDNITPI